MVSKNTSINASFDNKEECVLFVKGTLDFLLRGSIDTTCVWTTTIAPGQYGGLLCKHCNSMISRWLHDDVDKIKRVLKYFQRKNPRVTHHKVDKESG
jgi:hypothetical protein